MDIILIDLSTRESVRLHKWMKALLYKTFPFLVQMSTVIPGCSQGFCPTSYEFDVSMMPTLGCISQNNLYNSKKEVTYGRLIVTGFNLESDT